MLSLFILWGASGEWLGAAYDNHIPFEALGDHLTGQSHYVVGMVGLLLTGFVAIRLIHFNNGMLHGRVMSLWMVIAVSAPALAHVVAALSLKNPVSGEVVGEPPMELFYYCGAVFWLVSTISTRMYQKSFHYVLTDQRVHFDQSLIYLWSKLHTINLHKIENVIVESSLIGRVLGFGNVHLLTSSGIGIESESTSLGIAASSDTGAGRSLPRRIIRGVFLILTHRRSRKKALPDPTSCLFGVSSPTELHPLINDCIDKRPGGGDVD